MHRAEQIERNDTARVDADGEILDPVCKRVGRARALETDDLSILHEQEDVIAGMRVDQTRIRTCGGYRQRVGRGRRSAGAGADREGIGEGYLRMGRERVRRLLRAGVA